MDSDDESEASLGRGEDDPRIRLFYIRLILILIFITSAGEEEMEGNKARKRLRSRQIALRVDSGSGGNATNTSHSFLWEEEYQPPEPIDEVFLLKKVLHDAKQKQAGNVTDSEQVVDELRFPQNLSALFTGSWQVCADGEPKDQEPPCVGETEEAEDDEDVELLGLGSVFPFHRYENRSHIPTGFGGFQVGTFSTVEMNPSLTPPSATFPLQQTQGKLKMTLNALATEAPGLSQVDGMMNIFDGEEASLNSGILTVVSGYYLSSHGELSLVVNLGFHARRIGLEFTKPTSPLHANATLADLPVNGFINRSNLVAWDTSRLTSPLGKSTREALLSGDPKSMTSNNNCFFHLHLRSPRSSSQPSDPPLGLNMSSQRGFTRPSLMRFSGVVKSINCGVSLRVNMTAKEVDIERVLEKAWALSMALVCVTAAQISMCVMQLSYSDTQTDAAKASLLTIGMMSTLDALICGFCLSSGAVLLPMFKLFTSVALLKLILFAVCQMRYLLVIWRARNPEQFNRGWRTMRRELERLYCGFYAFICVCVAIATQISALKWLTLFAGYSFFVPQIVTNILRDTPDPFHQRFLFGMAVTRLFVPLYVLGCPFSLYYSLEPGPIRVYPVRCCLLVFYQAIQVAVLMMQKVKGARYLVPKRFLPLKYDYHRPLPLAMYNSECVICMLPIAEGREEDDSHMITPCNHAFHERCLSQWLRIKEECPTCRARLPPA